MQSVLDEIAAERRRQVEAEGWTPQHDDEHKAGELADAAACYAATTRAFQCEQRAGREYEPFAVYRDLWPWDDEWWKPKTRRRDLIRAAALIVAEIQRLDRAQPNGQAQPAPAHRAGDRLQRDVGRHNNGEDNE